MSEDMIRFDYHEIVRVLERHNVRFVVIGGVAGGLHGSATLTSDLDIVHSRDRENLRGLAAALIELGARRRDIPPKIKAPIDERAILNGTNFLLTTKFGDLDCLGETPTERFSYDHLFPNAVPFEIERGLVVLVVALKDLIRMKRATGRDRDRIEVERLTALLDETELREPAGAYRRSLKGRRPKAKGRPSPRAARARSGRERASGRGRA